VIPAAARAGVEKRSVALTPWEQAELGRETLEAINEETRTKADYTRAMDGYRAIYHANPADVHAPMAINAVAELLTEQGRALHDAKSLNAAIAQYEFLRKQYPASPLRVQALLTEGQIAQIDLKDVAMAREKYKQLLKEYTKSELVEEARAGLASLAEGPAEGPARAAANSPSLPSVAQTSTAIARRATPISVNEGAATHRDRVVMSGDNSALPSAMPSVATPIAVPPIASAHSGRRAAVTGIRHWSTATYTRVAIDLGDNVTYEAARVPNPDRIYFDLHGTRLAPELVGKSFAVTDDGFLKRVRAAQYSDDVTRVVLDVNDVTEYSAFLLPNPYRLIIDIHGGSSSSGKPPVATNSEPVAATIETPAATAFTAMKPTSRTTANSGLTTASGTSTTSATSEVANLSQLPGRVEATSHPTSKPISAVVETGSRDSDTGVRSIGDTASESVAVATPTQSNILPANSLSKSHKGKARAGASSANSSSVTVTADATPARAAVPTADGETSLIRALGLKIGRIVIDAGHGGHDSGTLGADGIEEKDVVLDVALRVGKLLHDRLGAEIIYTRSDDTFIPLETRTAIANKAQADLFLSIHANSSSDPTARGVETYYLNFTSDPTALDVAARENAVSDQSIHQLSDLVKKIALKDKIAESREFASDVEGSLYAGLEMGNAGLKDRGVKKAPFVVLIGANMPSILAEISFVTNPKDAKQLRDPEYRERVAESLYKGVAKYESGLSGVHAPSERASLAR
jgi:N-acetylmuramoyl-L-alanine amidase